MKIRADVAEMLHSGHSQAEVMRELHVCYATVRAAQDALKITPGPIGVRRAIDLHRAFTARTEYAEDGHLRWTGPAPRGGPIFRHHGKILSAYRIAFLMRYGRQPIGYAKPSCDFPMCVAGGHVQDRPMRERDRAAYTAIFGAPP